MSKMSNLDLEIKEVTESFENFCHNKQLEWNCASCADIKNCNRCQTNYILYDLQYRQQKDLLPVQIGQKLFAVWKDWRDWKITPCEVYAIRIDTKKNNKRFCVEEIENNHSAYISYNATFKFDSLGKTIFTTKEEATDYYKRCIAKEAKKSEV